MSVAFGFSNGDTEILQALYVEGFLIGPGSFLSLDGDEGEAGRVIGVVLNPKSGEPTTIAMNLATALYLAHALLGGALDEMSGPGCDDPDCTCGGGDGD